MSQNHADTVLAAAPLLQAFGLAVGYGSGKAGRRVLTGVNLALRRGELVSLLGPNGAGKSTLLRTLAGLLPVQEGRLEWNGRDAAAFTPREWAAKIGVVLTDRVETGLTVHAVVALGRHPFTDWTGRLREEDLQVIRWALETSGALSLEARIFDELSDGEKQKVLVARALAQNPDLLILDEPTAFLDLSNRVELTRCLRRLARQENRSVLISTHDLDLALRASDKIWLLPAGGPLTVGLPEDLALGGDFGRIFDKGDSVFDKEKGVFGIQNAFSKSAHIEGNPLQVFWAARALEREGFARASSKEKADIQLSAKQNETGENCWELKNNQGVKTFYSLEKLVFSIRALP